MKFDPAEQTTRSVVGPVQADHVIKSVDFDHVVLLMFEAIHVVPLYARKPTAPPDVFVLPVHTLPSGDV